MTEVAAPKIVKVEESERIDLTPIKESAICKTIAVVLPASQDCEPIVSAAMLALENSASKEAALVFMTADRLEECKLKAASAIVIGFPAERVLDLLGIAEENDIPVISLSKCTGKVCDHVYALRDRVEDEVLFVASHAVANGMTHIAILAPGGEYSDRFVAELARQASSDGSPRFEIINYNNLDNLSKLADFKGQAVIIIAKGSKFIGILDRLSLEDIDLSKWQVFGLSCWALDPLIKDNPLIRDVQCCVPDQQKYIDFRDGYSGYFKKEPEVIAVTAYDVVSFLIKNDKEGADINQTHLGIDGTYRFSFSEGGGAVVQRIRKIERLSPAVNDKSGEVENYTPPTN
jgi:hypothetical protein